MVEHIFKSAKRQPNPDNLGWGGAAKIRMHIALCYLVIPVKAITATKMRRPELEHTIRAFQ